MLLATSVATRLEPPTGRAAERNAAQRYGAHERERWRAAALARQAEDIGRRGARGLRERSPAIPSQDG